MSVSPTKRKKVKLRDEENPNQTHPGGVFPPLPMEISSPPRITLKNRFEPLGNDIPEPSVPTKPKLRIPPIVVDGVFEKHSETVKIIKKIIGEETKFHIRYGKNTSNVFVETEEAFNNLKKYFLSDDLEFHSFTRRDKKSHAFVVRGLNDDQNLEDLRTDLSESNLNIKDIFKMKGTRNPAYLVITDQKTTLRYLKQHVRIVNYTVVSWERHYSNRKITQCRRCQNWGHATSNCFRSYQCLKCAEGHLTKDCTKTMDTPAKCANCGGDHPANSIKCEVYINLLEKLHKTSNKKKEEPKKYIPAPLPKENPWEERLRRREEKENIRQNSSKEIEERKIPKQPTGEFGTFTELKNEFNKLNNFINISDFLQKIRTLNEKLARCESGYEKFQTFHSFLDSI